LSEEINVIEWEKKHKARGQKLEIERLREELAENASQIQSMQDELDIASQLEGESGLSLGPSSTASSKIQELEQEIQRLRSELEQKEDDATITDPNWDMPAHDPFDVNDDDDNMITNYDMEFDPDTELDTTPIRLNTSFPSPPSTMPNTPVIAETLSSSGNESSLITSDAEKDALKEQLESLQSHVDRLTSTIAFKEDSHARLQQKLSHFIPIDESIDQNSLDSALDTVLTRLALSQSEAREHQTAFNALTGEISNLGFPFSEPDKVLESIAQQFRQARLEIEYLTPGEVVEGFENDKILEMLVSRIKDLFEKVKRSDDSIDQYHDQELLLRQQINTHVSINEDLNEKLSSINSTMEGLQEELQDKETSNQRLQTALDSYRKEVTGLEQLIEKVEQDGRQHSARLQSEINEVQERLENEVMRHDVTRTVDEGKDMIITELERRLTAAVQAAAEVAERLATLAASNTEKDATIEEARASALEREMTHGEALALRDARVSELREEVERINESLKSAHSTILSLRTENGALQSQVEAEKQRGMYFAKAMNEQLARTMEFNMSYINADAPPAPAMGGSDIMSSPLAGGSTLVGSSPLAAGGEGVMRRGRFFDGVAEKGMSSKKRRRRYDSGLGFLDEEGELEMEM
jgi:DNA repair exonuclease SbcCD ATPase subunit